MARHVGVIGGGFVGLSTALHLQKLGLRVTLLDRAPIASKASCSYGNAGTFAAYANVPINKPGLWKEVPKMLASADSPLSILPSSHLLQMMPWFGLFLRACRPETVEKNALQLGALLSQAEAGYEAVWEQASVNVDSLMGVHASSDVGAQQSFAIREGYLILQRTEDMMAANAAGAFQRLRRAGLGPELKMEALTCDETRDLEPALSVDACRGGAWWFADGWCLREPAALLRALASGFEAGGGEVTLADVAALVPETDGGVTLRFAPRASKDDVGSLRVDQAVIACGAHSATLASSLGEWCPLDTERGHSITFAAGTESIFTRAVCDPSQGFISTPMTGGMRSAGTVELGGTTAGLTSARCEQLERATTALLSSEPAKQLGARCEEHDWLGFRPSMPDHLPVIGRSDACPAVLYAFGHQHVGWTLGGITGQLIAELVSGKEASIDLSPFSLRRFRYW